MRDEAWRPFLVICGWTGATGDYLPNRRPSSLASLSTAQTPQRQGRFTERAQLKDDRRLMGPSSKQLRHAGPIPRKISPGTAPSEAFPRKNSPSKHKNAEFGVF